MKIYFDENFSPTLVEALRILHRGAGEDHIEIYHIAKEFGRGSKDEDWIPKIGTQRGIVISQDKNIYYRVPQLDTLKKYNIGFFFYKYPKNHHLKYFKKRSNSQINMILLI